MALQRIMPVVPTVVAFLSNPDPRKSISDCRFPSGNDDPKMLIVVLMIRAEAACHVIELQAVAVLPIHMSADWLVGADDVTVCKRVSDQEKGHGGQGNVAT